MDSHVAENDAWGLFIAAWTSFVADPVMDSSVLKYHYRLCRKALDLDPSAEITKEARRLMASLHWALALCAAEEGLSQDSTTHCHECVRLFDSIDDLSWLESWCFGNALKEGGDFERACHAFSMALERAEPGNGRPGPSNDMLARLWDDYAGVYARLNDPDKVLECYQWALLYRPDSRFLQQAVAVALFYAKQFDRMVEASQWALDSDSEVAIPPLLLELLAAAAIRTDRLDVALQAYEKLLAECKNPEAREWYSRMLGYVEGYRDCCERQPIWDAEGFEWTSWHDRYSAESKADEKQWGDVLRTQTFREGIDDLGNRMGLLMFGIKEGQDRIRSEKDERAEVTERLRRDVFGVLWMTLKADSQDSLIEAELQIMACGRGGGKNYFSPVIAYNKAFQWELASRILEPFGASMQAKGVSRLTITGEEWDCRKLKDLRLSKVRDLFRGCQLILIPPERLSMDDRRYLFLQPVDGCMRDSLEKFNDEQKAFVTELAKRLPQMTKVLMKAEHKGPVAGGELFEFRSGLIGSHSQPGFLIRLVRLFPSGT